MKFCSKENVGLTNYGEFPKQSTERSSINLRRNRNAVNFIFPFEPFRFIHNGNVSSRFYGNERRKLQN